MAHVRAVLGVSAVQPRGCAFEDSDVRGEKECAGDEERDLGQDRDKGRDEAEDEECPAQHLTYHAVNDSHVKPSIAQAREAARSLYR